MSIRELAIELKLPYLKDNHQEIIDEALHTQMNYSEFINLILQREVQLRKENGVSARLRRAKFPIKNI